MPSQYYKNTIWTNHALDKLAERKLSQPLLYLAFQNPDVSIKNSDGSWKFSKKISKKNYTVIAKQNDQHEWLIISCWVDPPHPNTADHYQKIRYQKYIKSGMLTKLLMQIQKIFLGKKF